MEEKIFEYNGLINQDVIAKAIDSIEDNVEKMSLAGKLSTIVIEMCQNIMNYGKSLEGDELSPEGKVEILRFDDRYEIITENVVNEKDKEKMIPRLEEVKTLDKSEIKKIYKQLRKSGKNTHDKGGGIGIYEIAKVADKVEYDFKPLSTPNKYLYTLKVTKYI